MSEESSLPKVRAQEVAAATSPYVAGVFSIVALTSVVQLTWAGWVGHAWPAELSLDQAGAIAVLVSWLYTRVTSWFAPKVPTEPPAP